MLIALRSGSSDGDVREVERRVRQLGCQPHTLHHPPRTVVAALGSARARDAVRDLAGLAGVESVTPFAHPFPRASRELRAASSVVSVGGVAVGGPRLAVMAGPCTVESRAQLLDVATRVKSAGATLLRGGAFKPRTSPYAFQGLEEAGLELLREARAATGLPVITEVLEPDKVEVVAQSCDALQIGARNVQNFALLKRVAKAGKPVLLKRGMSTSIEEWLLSAEYVLDGGNPDVILCERGIRTFETATRFTLDLSAVPVLKQLTHLPVVVDPSHATGRWEYVEAMSLAGVAAGADGLLIEVHGRPGEALCDGAQSLKPERFARLVERVRRVAAAVEREL